MARRVNKRHVKCKLDLSPTAEKMECTKNSHFPCFFCSKIGENNSITRLSLSKIFNYLQLFPQDGKEKKLNYPSDEKFSSLSICEHCSEMAGEFSELYHLLEVTELKLNRCLERMQEVMTNAESDPLKPNDQKNDDLKVSIVERIKEISKLAHVELRSRSQIVPISDANAGDEYYSIAKDSNAELRGFDVEVKIECNEEESYIPPELQQETGSEQVKIKSRKRKRAKKDKKTRTSTNSKLDESLSSPSWSSLSIPSKICKFCYKTFSSIHATRRHMKYHCKDGPKLTRPDTTGLKLTCAYCPYECPTRQDRMKEHLIRVHPEMFFQAERNNSSQWKEENFKTILKEIIFPNFCLGKNGMSTSCWCSVCGKKCSSKNTFSQNRSVMTVHLINLHIEEVREYVKDIMEESDESLQEKYYLALHNQNKTNSRTSKEHSIMDVDESTSDQEDADLE